MLQDQFEKTSKALGSCLESLTKLQTQSSSDERLSEFDAFTLEYNTCRIDLQSIEAKNEQARGDMIKGASLSLKLLKLSIKISTLKDSVEAWK